MFASWDTLDDGGYTPIRRNNATMQQWLHDNYSADGIRYLVEAVSRFRGALSEHL